MQTDNNGHNRQAYSLQETAAIFGKHRSWAYRQVREFPTGLAMKFIEAVAQGSAILA
jgi:hypothetical protein